MRRFVLAGVFFLMAWGAPPVAALGGGVELFQFRTHRVDGDTLFHHGVFGPPGRRVAVSGVEHATG